jgi:hypothetical protein
MEKVISEIVRGSETPIAAEIREFLGDFDGDLIVLNLPDGYRLGLKANIYYREGESNLFDLCDIIGSISRRSHHGAGISALVTSLRRCTRQFIITDNKVFINIFECSDENRRAIVNDIVRQTSRIFGANRKTQFTFTYSS